MLKLSLYAIRSFNTSLVFSRTSDTLTKIEPKDYTFSFFPNYITLFLHVRGCDLIVSDPFACCYHYVFHNFLGINCAHCILICNQLMKDCKPMKWTGIIWSVSCSHA